MADIIENPNKTPIINKYYNPYYMALTCAHARLFVPLGIKVKATRQLIDASNKWATTFQPNATFNLYRITHFHADHNSSLTSAEFEKWADFYQIKLTFAAPRHQESNGIHEALWQQVRNLAFAMMNNAQVAIKWFDFALEHAFKVHSVLPNAALTTPEGKVRCPLGVFLGTEDVKVGRF